MKQRRVRAPPPVPRLAAALALCLLVASAAQAGILVRSESTIFVGVAAPPVVFDEGTGASRSRFVSVSISANGTSYEASLKGRVGGDAIAKDALRLAAAGDAPRDVVLRASQVSNANVLIYTWTLRNGSATLATLDMRAASPSASVTVPAGTPLEMDVRIKLAKGADAASSAFSSNVWAVLG